MTVEQRRAYHRAYRRKNRQEFLLECGGKCVRCGETDWRTLQFDHVFGGGHKEMRQGTGITGVVLTKVVRAKILVRVRKGELQLLCANCNWRKRYDQEETRLYTLSVAC